MRPSRLWSSFWSWVHSAPVKVKIMGIALGVILLLGLVVTLQVRTIITGRMLQELDQRGGAVARDVAGRATDLILTDNLFALQELVRNTMENNEDVRYVFVQDRDGHVLAHTFGVPFPSDLLTANIAKPADRFRVELLDTEDGVIHDVAVAILEGRAGTTRVGLSEQRLQTIVQDTTWLLLMVTGIVSLVGVAGAYLLTLVLTRPISQLVQVTRAVARGDFSQKARVRTGDEIGRLSADFNAMTEALARSRAEIEAFTRQLVRRNEELSALYDIAVTVSRSLQLEEILNGALTKVLEVMELRAGWVFLQDEQSGCLALAAQKGLSPQFATEEAEQELGYCICREVMDSREARVLDDIRSCPRLSQATLLREGLRAHASVPLKAKDKVLGIMNVAWDDDRRFPDEELNLLQSIGHQVGIAIENARLYAEVQRKEELRRQLLEQIILAQEDERKRVARELHDEVGQSLTALIMSLGSAEASLPPELTAIRGQLAEIEDLSSRTLEGIRRLMADLRPTLLDDLGLVPAIRWYAETHLARAGVQPGVEVIGPRRRLSSSFETALFRVVQEAVTNIVKHAGASQATVRVEFNPGSIATTIEDDGRGFDVAERRDGSGFGLLGMQERVTLLGGSLRIESEPGRGTRVFLEIPIQDSEGALSEGPDSPLLAVNG